MVLLSALSTIATCYYPDGVTVDPLGVPCNQVESTESMCCRTNYGDICEPNGLCFNAARGFWRDKCTDLTWESPFCLKNLCLASTEGGADNSTAPLTQCIDDPSYFCCGIMNSSTCCGSDTRIFLAATVGASSSIILSPSSNLSSAPTITSSLSLTTPTSTGAIYLSTSPGSSSTNTPSPTLSGRSKIYISIGVCSIAFATITGVYFVWQRRKNKRVVRELHRDIHLAPVEIEGTRKGLAELSAEQHFQEALEVESRAFELSSSEMVS